MVTDLTNCIWTANNVLTSHPPTTNSIYFFDANGEQYNRIGIMCFEEYDMVYSLDNVYRFGTNQWLGNQYKTIRFTRGYTQEADLIAWLEANGTITEPTLPQFDWSDMIADRTQADVDRAKYLHKAISEGTATLEEITEWMSDLKGCFNASDANRIGTALYKIKQEALNAGIEILYSKEVKYDWTESDRITDDTLYAANVTAVAEAFEITADVPPHLTDYNSANIYESILLEAHNAIRYPYLIDDSNNIFVTEDGDRIFYV